MSAAPRPISNRRLRHTLGTLIFASLVPVLMWCARYWITGNTRMSGFVGNLLLAWIPLGLAFAVRWQCRGSSVPAAAWVLGALWLLFFPNAFYIVTDLIHFKKFGMDQMPRLYDVLMTFAFAISGVFLGCLSLYLLQLSVRERRGWKAGWVFAVGMLALGAVGIYMGRYLRLNSWDVVLPWRFVAKLGKLAQPGSVEEAAVFTSTFFAVSVAVYAFVVSMVRLHEIEDAPTPRGSLKETE